MGAALRRGEVVSGPLDPDWFPEMEQNPHEFAALLDVIEREEYVSGPNDPKFPDAAQDPDEFAALLDVIERENIESILEIGVFKGGTLARFGARFPYANVVGIDPAPQFEHWRDAWGDLNLVYGLSQDPQVRARAIRKNFDRPFDVVHIDGDHVEAAVRADWEWARTVARKIVAFHDINAIANGMIDVYKLWLELEADPGYKTQRIGHQEQLGIGVVFMRESPAIKDVVLGRWVPV